MESKEKTKGSFSKASLPVSQQNWARFTFFFLAGMIAGMALILLTDRGKENQPFSDKEVRGTVYNSSSFDKMKSADVIYPGNPGLKTAIDVKYSTQLVEARIDISTPNPVKLAVAFGPNDFRVLNVQNLSVNDQSTVLSSANFIQIENLGDNKYIIHPTL